MPGLKILLNARAFYPAIGGLEVMSQQLAEAWTAAGHDVRVWTITPLEGAPELTGLQVIRCPSRAQTRALVAWSDLVVYSGITLRNLAPAIVGRRPFLFIHHGPLGPAPGRRGLTNALKRVATRFTTNIAVSRAVAATIPGPSTVIPNAFRPVLNGAGGQAAEREGLLVVGRLVSDKGVDLAILALQELRDEGRSFRLTICGDGPERASLAALVGRRDLGGLVRFRGWVQGDELAREYRRAQAVLVPSRNEPFGIVALEALSAGAPVVATRVGGLPEAVGGCGVLVTPEDPRALADGILEVFDPKQGSELMTSVDGHLTEHRIERVAARYLEVFESVLRR